VLNLNSEWGSGKTYFLKRWAQDLEQHYPVVYIDAWKQDYSKDPLMTVVSSLIKQLRKQAGKSEDDHEFAVPRKLIRLFKAAAPALARGLTKRYLGIDPAKIMEANDEGEILSDEETDEEGKPIDMGLAASKVTEHLIKEHDGKAQAIESLKINVKEWIEAVMAYDKKSYPAFIFIDELDRCRPSYAVEMLETIKHIFDIKGVVFVVATDTEQLQHAVKAVYGEGFNARTYLSRFFNSRFSLRAPDFKDLLAVHCDKEKLSGAHFDKLGITVWPPNTDGQVTLDNISAVFNSFRLSARTAIQITDRVIAILGNLSKGSKIDILVLTTLLSIREKDDKLYRRIVSGKFDDEPPKDTTSLTKFLESESYSNEVLTFNFCPKEIVESFTNKEQGRPNHYLEDSYRADFKSYLLNEFISCFKVIKLRSYPVEKTNKIDSLSQKLFDLSRKGYQNNRESGNAWLKYLHCHEGLEKLTSGYYQDLVELASALDWIDNEE